MKKLICFACLIALSLTSCSSSGDSSSATESDVLLKKSVETYAIDGSTVTTNYTYTGMKLVMSVDSDGVRDEFTYTGDFITNIKTYDSDVLIQEQLFTYNGSGQLVTYLLKDYDGGEGHKDSYVYNSNGTVSLITYKGDTTSQTDLLNTGTVYFTNGDVTRVDLNVTDVVSYTSSQIDTYDTKNNPFKNVTGMDKLSFIGGEIGGLTHNVLTDHYTSSLSSDVTTTTTYTYNSLNFPLTDSEIQGSDATTVISTVYTYN